MWLRTPDMASQHRPESRSACVRGYEGLRVRMRTCQDPGGVSHLRKIMVAQGRGWPGAGSYSVRGFRTHLPSLGSTHSAVVQ